MSHKYNPRIYPDGSNSLQILELATALLKGARQFFARKVSLAQKPQIWNLHFWSDLPHLCYYGAIKIVRSRVTTFFVTTQMLSRPFKHPGGTRE